MTDVHAKEVRSFNMSRIKGKDTKPELLVRKFLFSNGYRYRLYDKKILSKPDIVLPKYRKLIFIHGCFWHGHLGCEDFVVPKTRTDWWIQKIEKTRIRDSKIIEELSNAYWDPIIIWECELKPTVRIETLNKLMAELKS